MTTLVQEANRADVPEGKRMLSVLDSSGDTRIIWDPDNEDEVVNARRTFKEMLAKGFTAYSVSRDGKKDKKVKEFDAEAEKLILTPALVGG